MFSFIKGWLKERHRISVNKDMVKMFNMLYKKRRSRQEDDPECIITSNDGYRYEGGCDFELMTSFNGRIYIVDSHDILFMTMEEGMSMSVTFEDGNILTASLLAGYFIVNTSNRIKVPNAIQE